MKKIAHAIALILTIFAIAGCMEEEKKRHSFSTGSEAAPPKTDNAQKF